MLLKDARIQPARESVQILNIIDQELDKALWAEGDKRKRPINRILLMP